MNYIVNYFKYYPQHSPVSHRYKQAHPYVTGSQSNDNLQNMMMLTYINAYKDSTTCHVCFHKCIGLNRTVRMSELGNKVKLICGCLISFVCYINSPENTDCGPYVLVLHRVPYHILCAAKLDIWVNHFYLGGFHVHCTIWERQCKQYTNDNEYNMESRVSAHNVTWGAVIIFCQYA